MSKDFLRHLLCLLLLACLWAGTFIFVKIADQTLDPLVIMAVRGIISTAFLFIVLPLSGNYFFRYFLSGRLQLVSCCSGALIAYMWLTIAYSEKFISASMASLLLTALVPITWFIATFITREKPFYAINCLGIVIATFGIIIMIGFGNIMHANHQLWADLLYMSGLISFAAAAATNKRLAKDVNPLTTITFNLFYMAILLSIIAVVFGKPLEAHFTTENILALISLGIGSTGVGYLLYFYLSHHAGLVFAALSSYIVPIMGFLMGFLFLHETVMPHQCIGLLVVLIGMWFVSVRPRAR